MRLSMSNPGCVSCDSTRESLRESATWSSNVVRSLPYSLLRETLLIQLMPSAGQLEEAIASMQADLSGHESETVQPEPNEAQSR